MERRVKIYLPKISRAVDWGNFGKSVKDLTERLLPLAKPIVWVGLFGFALLMLQVFLIGAFDRLGISPKISLLASSLSFAAVFAGLAIFGGLQKKEFSEVLETNAKTQPICKILIIKREIRNLKSEIRNKKL